MATRLDDLAELLEGDRALCARVLEDPQALAELVDGLEQDEVAFLLANTPEELLEACWTQSIFNVASQACSQTCTSSTCASSCGQKGCS